MSCGEVLAMSIVIGIRHESESSIVGTALMACNALTVYGLESFTQSGGSIARGRNTASFHCVPRTLTSEQ